MELQERYRREGEKIIVDIKLEDYRQLFSEKDPSPFRERDLDEDAIAYILESVREFPVKQPMMLCIHIPRGNLTGINEATICNAIQKYFHFEHIVYQTRLKTTLKEGQIFFMVGSVFLTVCLYGALALQKSEDSLLAKIIGEGLNITGWVAMWRPVQTFLFDWWPIRKTSQYLKKISNIEISIKDTDPDLNVSKWTNP